eukprot:TRINITY_DN8270_c0_g1_i1.p1 TRINITY_DN8270_c0_g1~~TRINITY_DN8270_c0_g1_i1.p1  ORF type:complete len:460 (+),score=97.23 TRINITY_DN8270_c0_g1_i1:147-1526(+)
MNVELDGERLNVPAGQAAQNNITRYEPTVGLAVDKPTDSIKVKNAGALSLEDQFTYGVWVKPTNHVNPQEFFLVIHIANNYALSCGNGYVQVAFRNEKPGWMWKKTSIQLAYDQWTHIAVSYDSIHRQASVMKDGVHSDTIQVKGRLQPNVNHLIVKLLKLSATKEDDHPPPHPQGSHHNHGDDSFTGMIAHLKIWNCVLTEHQLKSQLSRPLNSPTTEDLQHLLCWWKFDEGYGSKVYDSRTNAPEGAILGCRWWIAASAVGKVDIPPSTLQNDLGQMYNNPLSSDVQLTVEDYPGAPLCAHKALLAARSEAFKAMLVNDMSESSMKTITLKEIKYDILSLLIQYLYTDQVNITEANVWDLLVASDKYQIKRLQAMCEDFMMKNIDLDNVCNLFELADKVHATQLKTFCMNWIVSNWSEVFKRGDDMQLPFELQREIRDVVSPVYFPNPKRRKTSNLP